VGGTRIPTHTHNHTTRTHRAHTTPHQRAHTQGAHNPSGRPQPHHAHANARVPDKQETPHKGIKPHEPNTRGNTRAKPQQRHQPPQHTTRTHTGRTHPEHERAGSWILHYDRFTETHNKHHPTLSLLF